MEIKKDWKYSDIVKPDDMNRIEENVGALDAQLDGHSVQSDVPENAGFTTTTNMLKPTLESTTKNSVTCTLNDDGTYTLTGTASALTTFSIECTLNAGIYKLVGCPENGSLESYGLICKKDSTSGSELANDTGNGSELNITDTTSTVIYMRINKGYTCDNLVFRMMITKNLQAEYHDYVQYTGNTGVLNDDVANLAKQTEKTYLKKTDTAEKATCDGNGNSIVDTYIKKTSVDSELSATSSNLLRNKAIAEAVAGKLIGSMGDGQSVSVTLNPLYKYLLMAGTASSPTIYFVYYRENGWYCGNGNTTFGSFSGNTFTFGSDRSGGSYLYKI